MLQIRRLSCQVIYDPSSKQQMRLLFGQIWYLQTQLTLLGKKHSIKGDRVCESQSFCLLDPQTKLKPFIVFSGAKCVSKALNDKFCFISKCLDE